LTGFCEEIPKRQGELTDNSIAEFDGCSSRNNLFDHGTGHEGDAILGRRTERSLATPHPLSPCAGRGTSDIHLLVGSTRLEKPAAVNILVAACVQTERGFILSTASGSKDIFNLDEPTNGKTIPGPATIRLIVTKFDYSMVLIAG